MRVSLLESTLQCRGFVIFLGNEPVCVLVLGGSSKVDIGWICNLHFCALSSISSGLMWKRTAETRSALRYV
jgi:hypothetical protein